jgi:hypothetical protein
VEFCITNSTKRIFARGDLEESWPIRRSRTRIVFGNNACRLFWRSDFRDEVLSRLLALNAERHAEEVRLGVAPRMKVKARGAASSITWPKSHREWKIIERSIDVIDAFLAASAEHVLADRGRQPGCRGQNRLIVSSGPRALSTRVERYPQAERLLSRRTFRSFEASSNLFRRSLPLGEALQFANVVLGPFSSLRSLLCHDVSSSERRIL